MEDRLPANWTLTGPVQGMSNWTLYAMCMVKLCQRAMKSGPSRESIVGIYRVVFFVKIIRNPKENNTKQPILVYNLGSKNTIRDKWCTAMLFTLFTLLAPLPPSLLFTLFRNCLWKGPATKLDKFLEKCQRGGAHFQSKNLYCRFWEL